MGARGRSADSDRIDVGREWVAEEVSGCQFPDQRLGSRLHSLMGSLGAQVGSTIPTACEDWASIKAAYRFLSNDRVDEHAILSGHMKATARRIRAADGPILILHDTTEFSYDREDRESIGYTREMPSARKDVTGKTIRYRVCGVMMHSSLAITLQGVPLGLCAVKFWSRKQFKGTQALKNRINPTRIPIEEKESYRWLQNVGQSTALCGDASRCVHIGDREADIYELFCTAHQRGAKFLFRTCVDRLAGDGKHTIADEMAEVAVKGLHQVEFRDKKGKLCHAVLELRYRHIRVRPPTAKQKHYPDLELTVLYARERNVPKGRKPLDWKLITNMPVRSRQQAIEKLDWYAMRWKIETFHKVLKSGCKAEEALLRTADRLQPDCDLLHSELAHSLADDVQSHQSGRRVGAGLHGNRDAGAGREDIEYGQDQGHAPFSGALCDHACASGRVYRAAQRPPAREQGDLARDGPIDGHCVQCDACQTRCG